LIVFFRMERKIQKTLYLKDNQAEMNETLKVELLQKALGQCIHPQELQNLDSLDLISELLARPCLTIKIVKLYRPLVLDLVSRWKDYKEFHACPIHGTSASNSSPKREINGQIKSIHESSRMECIAFALAQIIAIIPQITRYCPIF
jgi:hypothetical protein